MIIGLIAALGAVGAATRFVLDGLIRTRFSTVFPVATVSINLTGSLLLGMITGAAAAEALTDPLLIAAAVGFCGSYTTYSTAMVETVRLVQAGHHGRAALNEVGTGILTVLAVLAGLAAAALVL